MPAQIAFLHTSPVHVATFDRLLRELAPEQAAAHVVDESLLVDARRLGANHPEVVTRVNTSVLAAAESGAKVVVCTCSTVGGIAERTETKGHFTAMRVDRPMADEAVRLGPLVLVAAALQSTLAPTRELVEDSAAKLGRHVRVTVFTVPGAWEHFERGEVSEYHAVVAEAVRTAVKGNTVVVLAQASMAGAAELLLDLAVPVLTSPRLGVQAASQLLRPHSAA